RLRPIEIGQPDYAARRSVASIHAGKFGVDAILRALCKLTLEYLPAWEQQGQIPAEFLQALFTQHPPFKDRYETQAQAAGFLRELQGFFHLIQESQQQKEQTTEVANPMLTKARHHLVEIARAYGLDLTQVDLPGL